MANYGDYGPYGADNPYGGAESSGGCSCGDVWRYEACDIRTGRVKAVLKPISKRWEGNLSKPGTGDLVLATREYKMQQIFAHTTSLYVSIVHKHFDIDGNLTIEREPVFGGYIETHGTQTPSTTQVGTVTIDQYLFERVMADADSGLAYAVRGRDQNLIGAQLVNAAAWNGIPLTASWETSAHTRDRNWQAWEFKNLGEAIQELCNEVNGPEYRVDHYYNNGYWRSVMHFADHIGNDNGLRLRSDYEGLNYQNQTDGSNHATRTYGVGQGEEEEQLFSVAYDAADIYPEFHQVVAWKDVADVPTLEGLTRGNVVNHRDPISTPGITVAGYPNTSQANTLIIPSASQMSIGDRVYADIQNGLNTFQGFARILSQEWIIEDGKPLLRTPGLQPEVRAGESVRLMPSLNPPTSAPEPPPSPTPGTPPPLQTAEPKPGLVSQMSDTRITESSGMTHSRKW